MKNEIAYIKIEQSFALGGTVVVEGAKNSLLAVLMASLLTRGVSIIEHIPPILDVYATIKLLEKYNVKVIYDQHEKKIEINSLYVAPTIIATEHFKKIRTSYFLASISLLHFNEFWLGFPGGDKIGKRPIDIHLNGFEAFGVTTNHHEDYIYLSAKNGLRPATVFLSYPSVGATQNLLLLAAGIEGKSVLYNAAQEPEILDLIEVLKLMGVKIELFFGGTIIIYGSKSLKPFQYIVMPDRLEASTLLIAAALTKGSIHIPNAPAFAMKSIIYHLEKMGNAVFVGPNEYGITLEAADIQTNINAKTMPYPGLSTDYQSPLLALMAVSRGQAVIHETVFENRMLHALELNKMGAQITVESDYAKIKGVDNLVGTSVYAHDIRATAALILAGLVASGTTKVFGLNHLLRGYYNFDKKLIMLGGNITFIDEQKPAEENFYRKMETVFIEQAV